jgi:DUF4097 and DUF4098 domain-containing protein YvlB
MRCYIYLEDHFLSGCCSETEVSEQLYLIEHYKGVVMKMTFLALACILLNGASVYGGGLSEDDLVNVQEIGLENIADIAILYRWEKVVIRQNDTDKFILKEYMSKDNPRYYASISNTGNKLIVKRGRRPIGVFINVFNARAEVFIPKSYMNAITIKTTSGGIEAADKFVCGAIHIESASGHLRVTSLTAETVAIKASSGSIDAGNIAGSVSAETISGRIRIDQITGSLTANTSSGSINSELANGDVNVRTTSGKINLGAIEGNVFAESSSGHIGIDMAKGNITAKTTNANIRCSAGENTENISLASLSGGITLNIPRNMSSNFSSRTLSGRLSTPFPEKLFMPVSDRKSAQGIIGGDNPTKNITIKTNSGFIRVDWTN